MEDIATGKLGSPKKIKCKLKDLDEILAPQINRFKNKDPQRINRYYTQVVGRVAELFFDIVIRDMITNGIIFMFPGNFVYMVIAQQSTTSKTYKRDFVHGQGRVMPFMVFTLRGFYKANGRQKFLSLSPKHRKLLREELDSGHIYPVIDEIIEKMKNYGH